MRERGGGGRMRGGDPKRESRGRRLRVSEDRGRLRERGEAAGEGET